MGNIRCDPHAIGPDNFHSRSADSRAEGVAHAKGIADAFDLLPGDVHDRRSFLKGRGLAPVLKHPWLAVDHEDTGQRRILLGGDRAKPLHHGWNVSDLPSDGSQATY